MNDTMVWKSMYRKIAKGDVIRTKVSNPNHRDYGKYVYAIADGFGFGCDPNLIGGAIYVSQVSDKLEETLERTARLVNDRWERSWGIEILHYVRYVRCEDCGGIIEADRVATGDEFNEYQGVCSINECPSGTVYFNIMRDGSTDPSRIKLATPEDYERFLELANRPVEEDGQ